MMSLAEAAAATQGTLVGPDVRFRGVSTDSRSVGRGQLFVAIRGEHYDGHAFLGMAKERGASAALVERELAGAPALPVVAVDDTRKGLGRLGRHWRKRFSPVAIGIAGANGKPMRRETSLRNVVGCPGLTNKNSCGATPPHNAGLNKPVRGLRPLGVSMGGRGG